MHGRLMRLLAVAVAVIATVGVAFTAGAAAERDGTAEMGRMHDEMHGHHPHTGAHSRHRSEEMDQMHAEMSTRVSPADAETHDRMHAACTGHDERTER